MTINRSQLFKDAWEVARTRAAKSGHSVRSCFVQALPYVWAIHKEAARRAALPKRPDAYEMGAKAYWQPGHSVRACAQAPIYNGW